MPLIVLTVLVVITSPWFLLLAARRVVAGSFYLPSLFEFLTNFFALFSGDFLFFKGDELICNNIPEVGVFYLWQLPFLLLGFYSFICSKKKKRYLGFLILTAFFSSFFRQAPNIFFSIPFLLLMSATVGQGIIFFIGWLRGTKKAIAIFATVIYLAFIFYNTFFSVHQYKVHYPKKLEQANYE